MRSSANRRPSRHVHRVSIVLLALIASLLGYQSFGRRADPTQKAAPSAIATFDQEKTFASLEEKKAGAASLTAMAAELTKTNDEMAKKLKSMEQELEDLQAGTPKHKELMEKLVQSTHEYKAQIDFSNMKLDIERARMMKKVYNSIRKAAEQLAVERGYSVVFVDDSISPIPPGTEQEMNRQISARRMVYTSPDADITEELISRMNAQWKNAGPAPAPAANTP
jgi:Skp family chaperone for outer membrane proteins